LQPLPFAQPVVVSLNPHGPIKAQHVLAELDYAHPIFDQAAIAAQPSVAEIQGLHRTFFAGAWTGYGFHEDGMQSGVRAAQALLQWHAQAIPTLA
jgi:predicted NAD/FAD-binding protein